LKRRTAESANLEHPADTIGISGWEEEPKFTVAISRAKKTSPKFSKPDASKPANLPGCSHKGQTS
jgi:hypothetical protein